MEVAIPDTEASSPPEYVRKAQQAQGRWWFQRYEEWQALYARIVVDRNNRVQSMVHSGERLLDVGSGFGDILYLLQNQYDECYGIDSASIMVAQARINLARNGMKPGRVLLGQAHELPFESNMFDTVTLLDVYEHIEPSRRIEALCEIRRVLQPSGELILATPSRHVLRFWNLFDNILSLPVRILKSREKRIWAFTQKSFTEQFCSRAELQQELQAAGFETTHVFREGFYPAPETMGLAGTWLRLAWKKRLLRSLTRLAFRGLSSIPLLRQKMVVRCVRCNDESC